MFSYMSNNARRQMSLCRCDFHLKIFVNFKLTEILDDLTILLTFSSKAEVTEIVSKHKTQNYIDGNLAHKLTSKSYGLSKIEKEACL